MKVSPKQHDLKMSAWGPYNKEHFGVYHVADSKRGVGFKLELFPALYLRRAVSAATTVEGDVRMWGASPSADSYVYRYELEWRDRVYCDARFDITGDSRVDLTCRLVNNTDTEKKISLNLVAGMSYPAVRSGGALIRYKRVSDCTLPERCLFIDAPDYESCRLGESLVQDGLLLGERERPLATGFGTLICGETFYAAHHSLEYSLDGREVSSVGVRYSAEEDTELVISLDGREKRLTLPRTEGFGYAVLSGSFGNPSSLTLRPVGRPVDIDCLAVGVGAELAEFSV